MLLGRFMIACVPVVLLLGACDKKDDEQASAKSPVVATELEPGKTAASLQLQAVVELVKGDSIADAKALEATINDPDAKLNAVDLDDDGVTDFVEVIELREGDKTVLELRAIPSSKKDQDVTKVAVVVARIEVHVEKQQEIVVHATYTEHIEHDAEIHVYHYEQPAVYEAGVLVVADGCFFHYVFVAEHELYLGHHGYLVIEAPHHYHVKHKKPKKHKGHHGHGHGHGHGGGGVIVTW